MRRFLTTLMILLVVLVAGLSALVLLVNPNDFRDYMVKQVAAQRLSIAARRATALARLAAA